MSSSFRCDEPYTHTQHISKSTSLSNPLIQPSLQRKRRCLFRPRVIPKILRKLTLLWIRINQDLHHRCICEGNRRRLLESYSDFLEIGVFWMLRVSVRFQVGDEEVFDYAGTKVGD